MQPKRLLLTLFCFCLISLYFSCTSKNQQAIGSKYNFTDYNYDLNSAMDAKHKADTVLFVQHLQKTLSFIGQQKEQATPLYLLEAFLRMSPNLSKAEVKSLLKTHAVVTNNPSEFYESLGFKSSLKEWVEKYAIIESPEKYYHPKHIELSARLDTLLALDQGLLGYTEDETYYSDTILHFINHVEEGEVYLFQQILDIHKEFGLLGSNSCKKCANLEIMYLHLNSKEIEQIKEYLLQSLYKGYLSANSFAFTYDRCYSELGEARKEFYYYFNFYGKRRAEDFKTVDKLSPEEKEIVNQRRKQIGIPPLPYEFCQLRNLND